MSIVSVISTALASDAGGKAALSVFSAVVGWIGSSLSGWWKSRDRYHAFVTWQDCETIYGSTEMPTIVIQSVHNVPISVTRLRVRNGLKWRTKAWPFDSEDPDYPSLPRVIEPNRETKFWLNEKALNDAAAQCAFLKWLWVPRVYIGVETMGRGERIFVAEGGLPYDQRRSRYQR